MALTNYPSQLYENGRVHKTLKDLVFYQAKKKFREKSYSAGFSLLWYFLISEIDTEKIETSISFHLEELEWYLIELGERAKELIDFTLNNEVISEKALQRIKYLHGLMLLSQEVEIGKFVFGPIENFHSNPTEDNGRYSIEMVNKGLLFFDLIMNTRGYLINADIETKKIDIILDNIYQECTRVFNMLSEWVDILLHLEFGDLEELYGLLCLTKLLDKVMHNFRLASIFTMNEFFECHEEQPHTHQLIYSFNSRKMNFEKVIETIKITQLKLAYEPDNY